MIDQLIDAIRVIQKSGPNVVLNAIDVDDKTRDQLVFEMMRQDRQNANPRPKDAARFSGVIKLYGVEITSPTFPKQNQ